MADGNFSFEYGGLQLDGARPLRVVDGDDTTLPVAVSVGSGVHFVQPQGSPQTLQPKGRWWAIDCKATTLGLKLFTGKAPMSLLMLDAATGAQLAKATAYPGVGPVVIYVDCDNRFFIGLTNTEETTAQLDITALK